MTDPPRARVKPGARIGWSSLEWRAYLATALATVYAGVWLAAAPSAASSPAREPPAEPPANAPSAPTVWLEDLPAAARPSIAIPPGWVLASRTAPAPQSVVAPAPRVRATPRPARPIRIRTRSS
ncbi:MAG TPA: hypothetical protein VL463_09240 [Kofleriaceae bacterium]|nr:hypothetical protein [Kofleriaceae bacterium]